MNADQTHGSVQATYKHADLTDAVIGIFYDVYNELGDGFLESVYRRAMVIALRQAGLTAEEEFAIPVLFRGQDVGNFRADILVDCTLIIELKAVQQIAREHEAQAINYLRATEIEVALLLNFGPKPQVRRLAYDNSRKICANLRKSAAGFSS